MSKKDINKIHKSKFKLDKTLILNRIKSHYHFEKEIEFAKFLGLAGNTMNNWYSRNTMDFDRVFTKCEELNPNWIINGKGDPLKSYNNPDEIKIEQLLDAEGNYIPGSASLVEEIDRLTKIVNLQEQTIHAQAKAISVMEQLLSIHTANKV